METVPSPPPFILRLPERSLSPFVFAAPHSGRFYPPDFTARSILNSTSLRQSEDAFVDQLFEGVSEFGGTLLVATYARAYLDLNRAKSELDPTLFTPKLDENGLNMSHRVKAGLGLIPSVISEGVPIYRGPLPAREAAKRCNSVHIPYHQKLEQLLEERRQKFGIAYLIDCHSMPSDNIGRRAKRKRGADIVLGDSWGSACGRDLTSLTEELFINAGFQVRRNVPYAGGYSTVHYGKPHENIHALQIEICRSIYMDEISQTPLPAFEHIKSLLLEVSQKLIERTRASRFGEKHHRAAE